MSRNNRKVAAIIAIIFGSQSAAFADNVFVVDAEYNVVTENVVGRLENFGHTVTVGGPPTDLTGFDQVWDLRYPAALTGDEILLYEGFITEGGFAYFTTENPGCCTERNNSVATLIMNLGGGDTVIGGVNGTTANVSSSVNTTYITEGITINFAAISAITNDRGIPLFQDADGKIQAMSWIGNAGALGEGITGTIITVSDINWLDNSRFMVDGTEAQQQNVQALDDIITGIVAGTVGGTISESGNGAAATNGNTGESSTPTVVSTSTADVVTTSSATSNTVQTAEVTYSISNLDANGYGTVENYTDTVETTTPVTTTTTTTTPVTTTTYSDGSTTTSNGTAVVTTASVNGQPTAQVTGSVLNYTSRTAPYVKVTAKNNYTNKEDGGKQRIQKETVTTTTTTKVTTTTYADGSTTVVNGESTSVSSSKNDYYYANVNQLESLDKISLASNGLLNRLPSKSGEKVEVFGNSRMMWSNADGYDAYTSVYGGGLQFNLTKGWSIGGQYNTLSTKLNGADSTSHMNREHFGVFNSFHGKNLALVTNGGYSNDKYDYSRNVEKIFFNEGKTDGTQWWVNNRLYLTASKVIQPFLGHTVRNVTRNGYTETGNSHSARTVDAFNKTTHVGEGGLRVEKRFGGKKNELIGMTLEASYATDSSYQVVGAVDLNKVVFVEGTHSNVDGVSNNSVAGKVKFRF